MRILFMTNMGAIWPEHWRGRRRRVARPVCACDCMCRSTARDLYLNNSFGVMHARTRHARARFAHSFCAHHPGVCVRARAHTRNIFSLAERVHPKRTHPACAARAEWSGSVCVISAAACGGVVAVWRRSQRAPAHTHTILQCARCPQSHKSRIHTHAHKRIQVHHITWKRCRVNIENREAVRIYT